MPLHPSKMQIPDPPFLLIIAHTWSFIECFGLGLYFGLSPDVVQQSLLWISYLHSCLIGVDAIWEVIFFVVPCPCQPLIFGHIANHLEVSTSAMLSSKLCATFQCSPFRYMMPATSPTLLLWSPPSFHPPVFFFSGFYWYILRDLHKEFFKSAIMT